MTPEDEKLEAIYREIRREIRKADIIITACGVGIIISIIGLWT